MKQLALFIVPKYIASTKYKIPSIDRENHRVIRCDGWRRDPAESMASHCRDRNFTASRVRCFPPRRLSHVLAGPIVEAAIVVSHLKKRKSKTEKGDRVLWGARRVGQVREGRGKLNSYVDTYRMYLPPLRPIPRRVCSSTTHERNNQQWREAD